MYSFSASIFYGSLTRPMFEVCLGNSPLLNLLISCSCLLMQSLLEMLLDTSIGMFGMVDLQANLQLAWVLPVHLHKENLFF